MRAGPRGRSTVKFKRSECEQARTGRHLAERGRACTSATSKSSRAKMYVYMHICYCVNVCPRSGTKLAPFEGRDNRQLKCQRKTLARTDDQHMCELPMNVHMRLWLRIFSSNAAPRKRLEATAVGQKFAPLLDTSTHGLVLWWHPPCPQGSMLTATCH